MQILKGEKFAERIDRICAPPIVVEPLADLKYERVLVPGMVGGENYFALVGLIAQALRLRGADVLALQCDEFLPACTLRKADHHESACTRWCHKNAGPFARAMRLPHRWYSEFISSREKRDCDEIARAVGPDELADFRWRGIDLGEHVLRSVESYFKVGRLDPDDPQMLAQAYEFLRAGLYLVVVGYRALEDLRIDKVLTEDGKKIDWGVIRSVAGRLGIPVDVIRVGLRGHSIRFEVDRPPARADCMPRWDAWKRMALSSAQNRRLDEYFRRREKVTYEFRGPEWHRHTSEPDEVRRLIGLPRRGDGLVLSMFPNVSFDAGKTKTRAAFETAEAWVIETVRRLERWPRHHLVIKTHPWEERRQARFPLVTALERHVGALPDNVHLVPASTDITAHSVVRLSNCCLVYSSTVAVEAGVLGKPVLMVGGGWNSGRGFTLDLSTPRDYLRVLDEICATGTVPPAAPEIARRFAYAQFFRVNIPVTTHCILDHNVTDLRIDTLADLAPGRDPCLDVICRGILRDEPFEAPGADAARSGVDEPVTADPVSCLE